MAPPPDIDHRRPLRIWSGLSAFYIALFAVLGVFLHFLPLWLKRERGLSESQVAWVWSAQTAARTVAGPLFAQWVDRSGQPRRALMLLSLLSLLAFVGFGFSTTVIALAACSLLFGCFYPAIHSILDALSMASARRYGFAYGRLRLTGSLSFLLAVIWIGGWLEAHPTSTVFDLILVGLVIMTGASLLLPDERGERASDRAPIGELLGSGQFVLLLVTAALIQGSHAVYYNLSTIHWTSHGVDEQTVGWLVAEGVLAEIVLFFVARSSVDRLRPTTVLMLGGALAMVRWVVLGCVTSVPLLFLTNWLHGFSFGCTYLGALRAIEKRVAANQRSTAQGLLGAAASGIGLVVASVLGGYAYERSPLLAFLMMAAFALAGTGLALVLRRRGKARASAQSSAAANP